jgi:hypothetical protein
MKKFTLIALLLFSSSACAQSIELYLGKGRVWVPGKGVRTEGPTLPGIGIPSLDFYIPPKTMPGVWPLPAKGGQPTFPVQKP